MNGEEVRLSGSHPQFYRHEPTLSKSEKTLSLYLNQQFNSSSEVLINYLVNLKYLYSPDDEFAINSKRCDIIVSFKVSRISYSSSKYSFARVTQCDKK